MRESLTCPGCGASGHVGAHAVLAPWICELVGVETPQPSLLLDCPVCGLSFFSMRYEADDLACLYSGYRSDSYVTVRRRWEPWYGDKVNNAFEPGTAATMARVRFLEGILRSSCGERNFSLMVDVGGDAGQFFPTYGSGRRVLIDPSHKSLPAGIERVDDLSDLAGTPDLVLVAHLLEHLPDPSELLRSIHERLADNGRLYVEVPMDRPHTIPGHAGRRFDRTLRGLAKHRLPFVAADFISGAARHYGWSRFPLPVVKQSEHINYFTPDSLGAMLARAGFRPVNTVADPAAKPAGLRLGLLGVVAERTVL